MGADFMDYIVADKTIIPAEQHQHHSEKIVYMPHSYQANDAARHISEAKINRRDAGLPEQGFVFCSFDNSFRITPDVFDIWMRLPQTS